jgi:shikimate kinase
MSKAQTKKKKAPLLMEDEEIKLHKDMKKRNPTYPKLPKFLVNKKHKPTMYKKNKGLQESVMRGFYKRLSNWKRSNHIIPIVTLEG